MSEQAPHLLRPTLARAEGVHVWDVDGRRYLDAISGSFCVQLGYGRSDLMRAMAEAAGRLPYARPSVFESEESEAYARELLEAVGSPYVRALFTSSASEAVDAAIKAAHRYQRASGRPERSEIAHLRGHFHGSTLAALRVTDYRARRAAYEALLGGTHAIDTGGDADSGGGAPLGATLERGIGDAAALIAETIPAAGLGARVPRPGALAQIRRACDARGALWIADEALTGFGRVGSTFAWKRLAERREDTGATPDIIVFGKGAGGGYAAIAGVLLAERVVRAMDKAPDGPFTHAQTYGGHAVACAVGRRLLAALREERIEERVRAKEPLLREALAPLSAHPNVSEVRGLGFLWGIVLREERGLGPFPRERRIAERVEEACRAQGFLIYAGTGSADGERGDHLLLAPPLVCDSHHFAQIAIGVTKALDEVTRDKR